MRIAMVSFNCCMRLTQTALVAKAAGHEVFIVSHIESAVRQFNDQFDGTATFHNWGQLKSILAAIKPDIVHVHDRPHKLPASLVDAHLEMPLVHDLHDMFSIMVPGVSAPDDSPFEDKSILGADGLVFVSGANQQTAMAKYGEALPPSMVVRSGVFSGFYISHRAARINSGVWGGGLYMEDPGTDRHYIDQREIVMRFNAVGQSAVIFHAPTDGPHVEESYRQVGALVGGMLNYQRLIFEYSRYDFGWYGQTEDHPQIHGTIPNKLFEYVAAGTPVVVINADEAGKFVEDNGIGVHIRRPEDIVYVHDRLEAIRPVVWEKRWQFTRDKECEALWPFYEKLIAAKKAKHARL